MRSTWVVDASGQGRALLGDPAVGPVAGAGRGLEWLLQVCPGPRSPGRNDSPSARQRLGAPGLRLGLSDERRGLKLGVCRLVDPERRQPPPGSPISDLGRRLLESGADGEACEVLDRHGGLVRSTIRRREPHRRGRLVGLGDVVSTANLLGGEGIRHALTSSRVLAPLLFEALGSGGSSSAGCGSG